MDAECRQRLHAAALREQQCGGAHLQRAAALPGQHHSVRLQVLPALHLHLDVQSNNRPLVSGNQPGTPQPMPMRSMRCAAAPCSALIGSHRLSPSHLECVGLRHDVDGVPAAAADLQRRRQGRTGHGSWLALPPAAAHLATAGRVYPSPCGKSCSSTCSHAESRRKGQLQRSGVA